MIIICVGWFQHFCGFLLLAAHGIFQHRSDPRNSSLKWDQESGWIFRCSFTTLGTWFGNCYDPPVISEFAMENGPVIGDLPIKNGVFFQFAMWRESLEVVESSVTYVTCTWSLKDSNILKSMQKLRLIYLFYFLPIFYGCCETLKLHEQCGVFLVWTSVALQCVRQCLAMPLQPCPTGIKMEERTNQLNKAPSETAIWGYTRFAKQ